MFQTDKENGLTITLLNRVCVGIVLWFLAVTFLKCLTKLCVLVSNF